MVPLGNRELVGTPARDIMTVLPQTMSVDYDRRAVSIRTLSKSDFTLARTCDAKLYFKENRYPDKRDRDAYLSMLAEGGYMVEALAKMKFSDGIQLAYGRDVAADLACTLDHLKQEEVTLFEATLLVGRRQARVDVLQKRGNVIRLFEIKAKSFNGAEHAASLADGKAGALRGLRKPFKILSDWEGKLDDITFQVLLLEHLCPGVTIKPYLVLVDTSKNADLDNVPSLFELVHTTSSDGSRHLQTARYIGSAEQLAGLDLITEVDVSAEVAMLRDDVEAAAMRFEARLDEPLAVHTASVQRGSKCSKCEFRVDDSGEINGFAECWGALAAPRPHMLELYSIGTARAPDRSPLAEWMVANGSASLFDIPEEGLTTKDGTISITAERQRRQIEYTRRNEIFVGSSLRGKIEALRGPMHFIDFETSRLALPYHRGMRPYGLVTFQWSCHTVTSAGTAPVHREWLNDTDVWPNLKFAQSLREAVGDDGPVLTWSHFEAATLKEIIRNLEDFGHDEPELVAWITDVFTRRIVDLHDWAKVDYYHPGMRGRTSIKVVLDALWKSDARMRAQFHEWTGLTPDASGDPYAALPAIAINGLMQDVHEGTGAMRAYQEMMYGVSAHDTTARFQWGELLRQYCRLDTLSMVLILDHWRRVTGADGKAINQGIT